MKRIHNKRGVALIIVLAGILYLTTLVVNLFSDVQNSHQIALTKKRKLQAFYLAKSAINLERLLIIMQQQIEGEINKMNVDWSQVDPVDKEPLYKRIPIDTTKFRMLMGSSSDGSTESDDEESAPKEESEEGFSSEIENFMSDDSSQNMMGIFQTDALKDFFKFEGDFMADISEESSKYSLNAIYSISSGTPAYDLHKRILLAILQGEEFKDFYKNPQIESEDLTHAINDFIDANSIANGFDKAERGNEASQYNEMDYKPKNGPLLSLSELRLVPQMSDDILENLQKFVTVYHINPSVNICLAEPEIVDALIVHFSQNSGCTTAIAPDNIEEISRIRDEIMKFCPNKTEVAKALNSAMGLKNDDIEDSYVNGISSETESEVPPEGSTEPPKPKTNNTNLASKINDCKVMQFEDLLNNYNTVFSIVAEGEVKDVTTKIRMVVDTGSQASSGSKAGSKWQILYYQVE